MFYNTGQGTETCLTFASFIFERVTHKSIAEDGMEAVGDREGPMAFPFFESHRGHPMALLFFELKGIQKGDLRYGHLKESEGRIE